MRNAPRAGSRCLWTTGVGTVPAPMVVQGGGAASGKGMKVLIPSLLGLWLQLTSPRPRDERGLSQSTENAILLAGAVTIALIIVGAITLFVQDNLPK